MKLAGLEVPQEIIDAMNLIKTNDEAMKNFAIDNTVELCKTLLLDGESVPGIHFFTLNREVPTIDIVKKLGLWKEDIFRPLALKIASNDERCKEIIWMNKAYVS